jgi:hypothetical protein
MRLESFDSDGFTLHWFLTDLVGSGFQYSFIVIGGDVTEAKADSFTAPSTTGQHTVTGIGFIPDFVFLLGTNMTEDDAVVDDELSTFFTSHSFGCFNGVGEQAVNSVIIRGGVSTTDTARYQRTDKCLAMFSVTSTSTLTHEAEFVAMDTDGFVLNYTTASTANKRVAYLAFKGCQTKIATLTSQTVGSLPVSQPVTGAGLELKAVMFMTVCGTSSSSVQNHARQCFGFVTDGDNRSSKWTGSTDNVGTSICASMTDTDQCIRISTETASAGSSTTQAMADFVSYDEDGFTIEWDVIDASNAYEVIYIAFADTEAPPPILVSTSTSMQSQTFDMLSSTNAESESISTVHY